MKKRYTAILTTCLVVCAAFAWVLFGPGRADIGNTTQSDAGYRVYIDAATGAIVPEPNGTEPIVLDKEVQNALSTSSAGLVEMASPVDGKAVMVLLDGRFQNTMMATVDHDGKLTAPCVSGLPATDNTAAEPTPQR